MIIQNMEVTGIQEIEARLGALKNRTPLVVSRAIRRAAIAAKAGMAEETKKRYTIKSKDVKEAVFIKIASSSRKPKAAVFSKGEALELEEYYKLSKGKKLKAAVKKGGMKPIEGDPKAFMATMTGPYGGKHTAPFRRRSLDNGKAKIRKTREPGRNGGLTKHNVTIHEIFGPAIPSIIKNEETMQAVQARTYETLEKRINAEIANILRKGG